MRVSFLTGLLCGLVLAVGIVVAAFCVTKSSGTNGTPLVPWTVQPAPLPPTVPPNSERRVFNGMEYYIVPLSIDEGIFANLPS